MNRELPRGCLRGLLLAVGLAAGAAQAASVKPTTSDAVITCLAEAQEARAGTGPTAGVDTRRACIFKGAAYCLDRRGPGAERSCHDEERAAWDDLLNQTWSRLRAEASAPLFAAIQAEQRAWIGFRDAMCRRFYDREGVTSSAQTAERACLAKETAFRALTLDDILEDVVRIGRN